MVLLETAADHFVEPVVAFARTIRFKFSIGESRIGFHQRIIDIILAVCRWIIMHVTIGKSIHTQVEQLLCIQCLRTLGDFRETYPSVIGYASFANLTFLGRDKNYTVSTTRTVKSRSRGIFQYLYRSDIVYIDRIKTTITIAHHQTIDNVDRVRA